MITICNNKLNGHLSSDVVNIEEQPAIERMFLPLIPTTWFSPFYQSAMEQPIVHILSSNKMKKPPLAANFYFYFVS
jgi:hypothetical protein